MVDRGERAPPRYRGDGVRADRHRHFQRRQVLRYRGRICQGGRGRRAHAADGPQPRPGASVHPCAAANLVPQHLELVGGRETPLIAGAARLARARAARATGSLCDRVRSGGSAAVLRERNQLRARIRRQRRARLLQGRFPRLRHPRPQRGRQPRGRAAHRCLHRLRRHRDAEADAFYAALQKNIADEDMRRIQRQAFAGMLWNKQFYYFNVRRWLNGDPDQPPPPEGHKHGRNSGWAHVIAGDIMSMPDKWEYPWFAAWDLACHCATLSLIDPDFAKAQLLLLCEVRLMHPNGQLPAYEWAFGDVNPPVHAWAAMRVFENDRNQNSGNGDFEFLERVFHKLLLNFTWWVNRKDPQGLNIFEGGFLGLDNIGVFDRSRPLPTAATSSNPTARPGWRCFASTCCAWRSSSAGTIGRTRTWRSNFSTIFCTSPGR